MTSLVPAPSSSNSGTLAGLGYPPVYAIGMKIVTPISPATGVPTTSTVDCIDYASARLHMTAPATSTTSASNTTGLQDATNVTSNTVFSHVNLPATPPTVTSCNSHCGTPSVPNTIVQTVPTNWVFSVGSNNTTDLNSGILAVSYGVETNPTGDGYDAFTVQVSGSVHSGALLVTLAESALGGMNARISAGDSHRLTCRIQISAGPNGHLWGVQWPQIAVADTTSGGTFYLPPGGINPTLYTNSTPSAGGGGTGIEMTDKDLLNGSGSVITLQMVTVNSYTTGMTTPITTAPKLTLVSDTPGAFPFDQGSSAQNVPVSATIRYSRCSDVQVTS